MDVGPSTARSLALQLRELDDLRGWEQAHQLAERCSEALSGGEGIDRRDLTRVARWAARWRALRPEIREFYRDVLQARPGLRVIGVALWNVLERGQADHLLESQIKAIFEQINGYRPGFNLASVPVQRRTIHGTLSESEP